MSKKIVSYFLLFALLALGLSQQVHAQGLDPKRVLEKAHTDFDQEAYGPALEGYEKLYEKGFFSEKMLYRLSFIHESKGDLPLAVFYLRKLNMEYGGEYLDDKIRQLIQRGGGTRIFTSDGWDSYHQFFGGFGIVLWAFFLLAAGWLIYVMLIRKKEAEMWQRIVTGVSGALFGVLCVLLLHYNFLVPDRAVITEATSFYSHPAYGSYHESGSLSLGETVEILDQSDIWTRVQAGSQKWWVPNRVLRRL